MGCGAANSGHIERLNAVKLLCINLDYNFLAFTCRGHLGYAATPAYVLKQHVQASRKPSYYTTNSFNCPPPPYGGRASC